MIIILLFFTWVCESLIHSKDFESESELGSVYLGSGNEFVFKSGTLDPDAVAYAKYNPQYLETGWDYLTIWSNKNKKFDDLTLARGVGFIEGVMTQNAIFNTFTNYYSDKWHDTNGTMPEDIKTFITEQEKWIEEMYRKESKKDSMTSQYWNQVFGIIEQAHFMLKGYNSVAPKDQQLSYMDIQVLTNPDIDDLLNLKSLNLRKDFSSMEYSELVQHIVRTTSCSALVKLGNDFEDLWIGHTTWEHPTTMNRIWKTYNIYFWESPLFAKTPSVSFSSYPGSLSSQDDIYGTSSQLATIETTNNVWDNTLWDKLTYKSLFAWTRVILANRMDNCKDWMFFMSYYNSGTYNNQWICLDYKKFTPGQDLEPETMYVGEQIPGDFESADCTVFLREGYFPSYNVPFFERIFNESGYPAEIKSNPTLKPLIDYDQCVRANIFRRDANGKIANDEDFGAMLRYNDYLHDTLELSNPSFAIAARYDLDETYFNPPICHMSTDTKFTSYLNWVGNKTTKNDDDDDEHKPSFYIISSPTYGGASNIPPFSWKTTKNCDKPWLKHEGQPEEFKFDWVKWELEN